MSDKCKIGVFLCECGRKIAPLVDLKGLLKDVQGEESVSYAAIEPYTCLKPGLDNLREAIQDNGLNRVVVAGCEGRILLKKLERELAEAGLESGEIDMVNLRDHVAQVHDLSPEDMAAKGFKLIKASVAGWTPWTPVPRSWSPGTGRS
jgi:heterodisulfide reductase subunit A